MALGAPGEARDRCGAPVVVDAERWWRGRGGASRPGTAPRSVGDRGQARRCVQTARDRPWSLGGIEMRRLQASWPRSPTAAEESRLEPVER